MTEQSIPVIPGLRLTHLSDSDVPNFVAYLNDPDIFHNTLMIPYPYYESDARQFIGIVREFELQYGKTNNWAIRNDAGEMIGCIGLLYTYGVDAHKTETGYWLARPFRGRGIMTAVLNALCAHLFETTPLVRIEAAVYPDNVASQRTLEKAGFLREGYLHKAYLKQGEYRDGILFARIKV